MYLLQLVQALKFDQATPSTRSQRRRETVAHEDSGLAGFLVERAVANPVFGTTFHWYLVIECDTKTSTGKMFAKVAFQFMAKLEEVSAIPDPCMLILDSRR